MVGVRILATVYTPGPDGLRQFRVGELVRLISDIGTTHPSGTVVSNDGVKFTVRWDFDCGETTFDLRDEQAAMKKCEESTIGFLNAIEINKAVDNLTAYTRARIKAGTP